MSTDGTHSQGSQPPTTDEAEEYAPESATTAAGGRRVFWSTFLLLWLLSALWAIGNPLMASPDEPAHAVKAAAVVRGQLLGDQDGAPAGSGWVEVPALFAQARELPGCYAYLPQQPASCARPFEGDLGAETRVITSAVRYSPVYYLLTGLPSLFGSSAFTLYAMRILSALLCSLLLALAFRTLTERRNNGWPVLGAAAALTPMVMFLNGTINPQSVEISSAVLVWVTVLAVLRDPCPDLLLARVRRLALGASLLVSTRSLGPLFLVAAVVVAVWLSPRSALIAPLRSRRCRPWLVIIGLAGAASVSWILIVGALDTGPAVVTHPELTGRLLISTVLTDSWNYLQNGLGVFGWNDTGLPGWAYLLIAAPLLVVIAVAVAVSPWRARSAMAALLLMLVLLPFAAQWNQAQYINLFWQGRYGLPLAVGLPIAAGTLARFLGTALPMWFNRPLAGTLLSVVVFEQTFSYAVNLQRNINGTAGGYLRPGPAAWLPPVSPYLLLGLSAIAWIALATSWLQAFPRSAVEPAGAIATGPPGGHAPWTR